MTTTPETTAPLPPAGSSPTRRRILLISNFFPPHVKGGAELACAHLAAWLAKQGHAVGVLTFAPPGAAESTADMPEGYRIFRRRFPNLYHVYQHDKAPGWKKPLWHLVDHWNPFSRRVLLDVIAEFQPEVVNTHNLQGMGYNLWSVLGETGLPVVATLHDPGMVCIRSSMFKDGQSCARLCQPCSVSQRIKNRYLRRIARLSFASPSQALLYLLAVYIPKNTIQARHVPNPLSFRVAEAGARDESRLELLYVGQISAHKGVEFIIQVLDALGATANFRLTLLGRGPLLEPLQALYGDRPWIRFEGFVPPERVSSYMVVSDLLLIPSLWVENAPLVAMEAIGLGLPMLTSSKGGLPELVVHEKTGLALEAGNANLWRETIAKLAASRSLIAAWKENAARRKSEFDVDVLGARYLALVERTINATPQSN